jgi:hypothetical protein
MVPLISYLTSCTPIKSKLYLDSSLETVIREPTLQTPYVPCAKSHVHIPLLRSFIQKIHPGPRLIDPFCYMLVFYGEGLLAQHPTPKLEDHPFSFVRGCLFNIFAANLQLEAVPSICNLRTRHAVVTRRST